MNKEKRVYIHAVYNEVGKMVCRAPGCGFEGDLTATAEHVTKNQFIVETPKPRKTR